MVASPRDPLAEELTLLLFHIGVAETTGTAGASALRRRADRVLEPAPIPRTLAGRQRAAAARELGVWVATIGGVVVAPYLDRLIARLLAEPQNHAHPWRGLDAEVVGQHHQSVAEAEARAREVMSKQTKNFVIGGKISCLREAVVALETAVAARTAMREGPATSEDCDVARERLGQALLVLPAGPRSLLVQEVRMRVAGDDGTAHSSEQRLSLESWVAAPFTKDWPVGKFFSGSLQVSYTTAMKQVTAKASEAGLAAQARRVRAGAKARSATPVPEPESPSGAGRDVSAWDSGLVSRTGPLRRELQRLTHEAVLAGAEGDYSDGSAEVVKARQLVRQIADIEMMHEMSEAQERRYAKAHPPGARLPVELDDGEDLAILRAEAVSERRADHARKEAYTSDLLAQDRARQDAECLAAGLSKPEAAHRRQAFLSLVGSPEAGYGVAKGGG